MACRHGLIKVIEYWDTKLHQPLNKVSSKGFTPLQIAVKNNKSIIVEYLLSTQEDIQPNHLYPFPQNQLLSEATYYTKINPHDDEKAFFLAIEKKSLKLIKLFLVKGFNINAQNSKGLTPLMLAIQGCQHGQMRDNLQVIELLLTYNPNRNITIPNTNISAFILACKMRLPRQCMMIINQLLLPKNEESDKLMSYLLFVKLLFSNDPSQNPFTQIDILKPFTFACQNNHLPIIKQLLLKFPIDLNQSLNFTCNAISIHQEKQTEHHHQTLFMVAIRQIVLGNANPELLDLLLNTQEITIDKQDSRDRSPLQIALRTKPSKLDAQLHVIAKLIKKNPTITDQDYLFAITQFSDQKETLELVLFKGLPITEHKKEIRSLYLISLINFYQNKPFNPLLTIDTLKEIAVEYSHTTFHHFLLNHEAKEVENAVFYV